MKKSASYILIFLLVLSCGHNKKGNKTADYSGSDPWLNPDLPLDARVEDLISRLTLEEKISQMTNNSAAIERLGIPEYDWWNECLHGVARAGKATVFPQAIGLAATFDDELMQRIATAISDEGRAKYNAARKLGNFNRYTGLSFWSPNINIFRDPRWGRGQETYGEDPYLTGRLGVIMVKGLQGNDPKYLKTAACAKHFAVHSGPERLRHEFNAVPSKKDLIETYLPAFRALVKEGRVEAVMCAYNRTYDLPCCGSSYLLNDILRQEWGFKGHIVSDCWALQDFYSGHNVVRTPAEAAAMALKAGVSVNCGVTYPSLKEAVDQGLVTEEEIDRQLAYLLSTRFRLGLFDPPELVKYTAISPDIIHNEKHIQLAREAAVESVVLLKNKNKTLPLRKDLKLIQIVGPLGNDAQMLYGNYYGQTPDAITIVEGIAAKSDPGTTVRYREGILLVNSSEDDPPQVFTNVASSSDVIIAVMGISNLIEGEEGSSLASPDKGDRVDIRLPKNQAGYLKAIRAGGDAPIILIVAGGSPVSLVDVEDLADAIVFVWYPGEQGGNAVADILFGDASPSGKLPVTFPMSVEQLPAFEDYGMAGRTYRYMEAEPEYPFGFGLGYTTFEYANIRLNAEKISVGGSVNVEVDVKNTGNRKGAEVVQLYLTDVAASARTPKYALKGFSRIKLEAAETYTVRFVITPEMMELVTEDGQLITEPGEFRVTVGGACPCPKSLVLGAPQSVSAGFIVEL